MLYEVITQCALERIPGERLDEELQRVDQEHPTVRTMKSAGLDHGEVGDQRAEVRRVVDATDQPRISGMIEHDHGRAVDFGVIDQESYNFV